MGSLNDRLRRLEEKLRRHSDTILLADGSEACLAPEERLDALLCATDGEPHPLHGTLRNLHPDASATDHELAALIAALVLEEA